VEWGVVDDVDGNVEVDVDEVVDGPHFISASPLSNVN